uniref:Uncharacterized protein n=1 Tax=Glossina pallidipes TaxID=7398 RepID=A0A1A9ZNJ3_GLOPL
MTPTKYYNTVYRSRESTLSSECAFINQLLNGFSDLPLSINCYFIGLLERKQQGKRRTNETGTTAADAHGFQAYAITLVSVKGTFTSYSSLWLAALPSYDIQETDVVLKH